MTEVMANYITCYFLHHFYDWDEFLTAAESAPNLSVSDGLAFSPFELDSWFFGETRMKSISTTECPVPI